MDPSTTETDWDIDHHIPGAFPGRSLAVPAPVTSTQQSLSEALYARRSEFTEPRKIRIKIGSWNVAALKGNEKDIGGWFLGGAEEEVGLYVLGLQEIVDITSFAEAIRPTTDPTPSNKIKAAIDEVLPLGYQLVAQEQLIGLLILVYAHAPVLEDVQTVSTTSVGTGLGGYMGNKGAVTARLVLGETTRLVFINSHLAAGADKTALDRRNWDATNITSRTRFAPIVDLLSTTQSTGDRIGDEDFIFWFGDLNYRLEGIPGDEVRRLLMLHTRNEYYASKSLSTVKIDTEISSATNPSTLPVPAADQEGSAVSRGDAKSASADDENESIDSRPDTPPDFIPPELDPASLQTTLNSLLPHDELHQQMKARKAFGDGWTEGPIRFLPTYKYDVGSVGVFDSSEKNRCPSWCDRILYRTKRRFEESRQLAKAQEQSKVAQKASKAKEKGGQDDDNVLFNYDPAEDGERPSREQPSDYDENEDLFEPNQADAGDSEITLESYASHQLVLSSDHKPLSAIFSLAYDAVLPEAKKRIHADVARGLDRAENEGRPTITVIVEESSDSDDARETSDANDAATVDFGKVGAGEPKKRSITVANTGSVPATVSFVERPPADEATVSHAKPSWLSIHWDRDPDPPPAPVKSPRKEKGSLPAEYTLDPGDACTIDLEAHIEKAELMRSLDDGAETADEILILRVLNGRDHFLPVTARWVESGFERGIDKLKGSIRKQQGQKPAENS